MKKLSKIIEVKFSKNSSVLSLGYYPNINQVIDGRKLFKHFKKGCLIEKKHEFHQTQFDLTNIENCALIIFNKNKEFVTIKPLIKNYKSPISFFISDPYVILLKLNKQLLIDNIFSLNILTNLNEN